MIPFPFTARELFLALSLIAPEAEARRLAEDMVRPSAASIGWGISLETLVLLSLVSPELNEKAEGFRDQYWSGLDPGVWSRTREELQRSLTNQQPSHGEDPDD